MSIPPVRQVIFVALLALASANQASHAEESPPASSAPPSAGGTESRAAGIGLRSGGIGQDEQEEMRRSAKSFNVHVLFATPQGAYLADIPFTVTDHKGKQVAAAMTEGPWLYLKLPPGTYQINAQLHGASQSRRVKVAPGAAPVSVHFMFPDQ